MNERTFQFIKKIIPHQMFQVLQPAYHFGLAFCAAAWYRFPSRHIGVIGVTGTKGKTSVVELLHAILAESGAATASISSLGARMGDERRENPRGLTMPGPFFLQRFLRRAHKVGCRWAVLEVSSQGIRQYRHRFITFRGAVMTNVAPEHIEAHGSFENYLRSKLDLFYRLPGQAVAVINRDSPYADRFGAATKAEKIWYAKSGVEGVKKNWPLRNLNLGDYGIMFDVGGHQIKSALQGDFNRENILAALSLALGKRIPLEAIAQGIERVGVIPGRMELVLTKPCRVVVDYAHTPDSLKAAYGSVAIPSPGRLICVLGSAGGGRDKWKRPEMGRVAATYCQEIIVTNEDPFDESPEAIVEEVASGVRQSGSAGTPPKLRIIIDRREAIRAALESARAGDVVIITGKGSEQYIRTAGGEKILWDDRTVVREEEKRLKQDVR